ncbi:Xaa-Pro peptidase family protein (plasmid) [Sinorhizobium meliloti]|uniref:M24 family metallopeptidase n=1 Tax=Rhizobium meliloti TaxID=382 RepID=UPI002D76A604|nr:Xaa-Pro peptidase family protein [Sinorhizobium meliloti]WRQ71925.1 Xaa-Pro peptidase family protein [Sinorhizobium meliloti]
MTLPIQFPPPFPIQEYRSRLAALRSFMAERKVDLLIVNQHEHMEYFAGYAPTAAMYQAILIPLDGEPVAVIRALDASVFSETSWLTDYVAFADNEDPIEVASNTIVSLGHGGSAIGVERDSYFFTINRAVAFEGFLPNVRFVDFSAILWLMRQVKSPLELACLQVAAGICDRATMVGFEAAEAGVSEREVLAVMISEALRNGADNAQLVQLVCGPRSGSLHGALGNRILAEGDIVHAEPVPHFRGYTSRMMRPKSIGAPTDEQMLIAEATIRVQDEQFRAMKPGAEAKEVDKILREGMLSAGLRDRYTNVTGYTLGLKHPPRTSDFTRVFLADSDWRLLENQVFHMYTGAGGMAFSETIVVTPEGGRRLTKMERRLFS